MLVMTAKLDKKKIAMIFAVVVVVIAAVALLLSGGDDSARRSVEAFRRQLGAIHCLLAGECDVVMEMAFGNLMIHKGEWE